MGIWHFFLTVTGTNNENGYWYAWWSAFAGVLPEFAILALVWRKINCHAKGCYRIGLHRVDGTPYTTCGKHHPVHPGSRAATAEEIAEMHRRFHARVGEIAHDVGEIAHGVGEIAHDTAREQ